jgi:transposase-like protein
MYFKSVSVRDMKKAISKMFGKDYYISPQTVSNLTKKLDEEVKKWQEREIKDEYPIIYLDGVYLNVKSPVKAKRRCVLVCMGIDKEGRGKILGYKIASYGESEDAWMSFINELYQRGLEGRNIEICIIDGNSGLKNAIKFHLAKCKDTEVLGA